MAKAFRHAGKRRFWSGKVDTLCGLALPRDTTHNWFATSATCPACRKLIKKGWRI
jgi:hypothetical protein